MSEVSLRFVDESVLPRLLEIAVADAEPEEVMPPVPGGPGWSEARQAAFATYHRSTTEATYAIEVDDEFIGAVRLAPSDVPGCMEIGIWLGRSSRGRGHGTGALRALIDKARAHGASALIADTTTANQPAIGALRTMGAQLWEDPETGEVHATMRV